MMQPFDDTQPTVTIQPEPTPKRGGALGLLLLIGAAALTSLAVIVLVLPTETPPLPEAPTLESVVQLPTNADLPQPTSTLPQLPPDTQPQVMGPAPTLNPERIALILQTPVAQLGDPNSGDLLKFNPYTFIPERPRSEFIEYTAVSGDTIDTIARRYGLRAETLAWCNDRRIVFVLRPGDVLRIPPVDGACHVVLGTRQETIARLAEQYKVPVQQLINSPYTNFFDMTPDTVLPGGLNLFIPGGEGPLIAWNPPSEVETDAQGNIRTVSFAKGLAGSCGQVEPGGGAAWANPLPNGTWVRGFSVGHTGIDLSAAVGTPIFAANSGPVLFSGFSTWGYGETVVLAHGPFSTLYAHMSQRNARCGQFINVGQVVGLVGSTGNSTGPHLHFEIRFNDQPQNPSGTPGIGW
jgi:murein DD-endopeptidase MepM/ murein hydrolase activator NlpD